MEFVFTGFRQSNNFRHFAFEGIAEDRTRTQFVVGADLMLIRKYQITMQELPLICLRLLEASPDGQTRLRSRKRTCKRTLPIEPLLERSWQRSGNP